MSDPFKDPPASPLAPTEPTPPGTPPTEGHDRPPGRSEAAAPTYRLRSDVLAEVPVEERYYVLERYEDAVQGGVVKAVLAQGRPPLRLDVITPEGRRARRVVDDEIILVDDRFLAWLARERRASKLAVLAVTGRIESSLERLAGGEDDFARLVSVRRKRLARTRTRASRASRGEG